MKHIYILFLLLILILLYKSYNNEKFESVNNSKTLVLYLFHEYNYNVKYFIKNGIFKDDNVDFILICNNEKIKLTSSNNIKVLNRKNIGYDFGGWSDGLFTNDLYKNYDNFIFVNSSVLGPILPEYYKTKWTDIFINGLTDDIKLYGSTINICTINNCDPIKYSHVQSYAFCVDRSTLDFLITKEIFSTSNVISKWKDVVFNKEIRMSQEIIKNGWNIGCLLKNYKNIDFRFPDKNPQKYNIDYLNNPTTYKYFNEYLHPYEVIFIKDKYYMNKKWINSYIEHRKYKIFNLLWIQKIHDLLYLLEKYVFNL